MAIPAWLLTPEERRENRARSLRNFHNAIPEHMREEAGCPNCKALKAFLSANGGNDQTGVCEIHKRERWNLCQDFFC